MDSDQAQAQQQQEQQKEKVKYTPDNKAVINVTFKGSNSYELQLSIISGCIQLVLSCKQNMFFRWITNINLDEELSKQKDLQDLCEGVSLEDFQQGLIDYIENNQYSIESNEDESAVIYFNDEEIVKKMNKERVIKKQFQFTLIQEDLMQANEQDNGEQQGFQKIATTLQDRIIVLENENAELSEQLELILDYIGTSAQEVKDYKQNPFSFQGISNIIKNVKQIQNLQKWIPEKFRQKKAKLLFRASLHDFSAQAFHNTCDGQGPLLFVMKAADGLIVGGFIPDSKNWDYKKQSGAGTTQRDPQDYPFLFAMKEENNVKCSLNNEASKQKIYNYSSETAISMGSNPDFEILGDDKKFNLSIGYTFNETGLENNNLQNQSYDDYEVFKL